MKNLSLWLAVMITWLLILASYLFPEFFTSLIVFILLLVLVFSIAANWAVSSSSKRSKRKFELKIKGPNHKNDFPFRITASIILI